MVAAGRRAEYAKATRESILAAARELFTTKGYFGTRVEDIARAARVAPATVYAVGGGKNGLIRELIETAVRSEANVEIRARIAAFTDPHELIVFIVTTSAAKFEQWSGLMRQVVAAAPQEAAVRESLELAQQSMRDGFARTAQRLADLGALRADLDVEQATDVMWFFIGNASYFTLTDDLAWPLPRSTEWLIRTLEPALLTAPAQ
ncbi:TetR/AcrR family transcriptional regulator [Pseudonocardia xinjiangensis]|uniref:TetR/AcrR family transcriptional regulator n=1 Tax=Pseudonocardia xinjiangensis TaxID=75289 RepID=UPI003D9181A9